MSQPPPDRSWLEVERPDAAQTKPGQPVAGPALGLLILLGSFLLAVLMIVGTLRLVVEWWPW